MQPCSATYLSARGGGVPPRLPALVEGACPADKAPHGTCYKLQPQPAAPQPPDDLCVWHWRRSAPAQPPRPLETRGAGSANTLTSMQFPTGLRLIKQNQQDRGATLGSSYLHSCSDQKLLFMTSFTKKFPPWSSWGDWPPGWTESLLVAPGSLHLPHHITHTLLCVLCTF